MGLLIFKLYKSAAGFSLIELAIVLMISGLSMSAAADLYKINHQKQVIDDTHQNIEKVRAAIDNFYTQFGRYPCPADPTIAQGSAIAGKENCAPDETAECSQALCRMKGKDGGKPNAILSGVVPYITLSLNGTQSVDGWGRMLAYVVTERLTSQTTFDEASGEIYLRKADGKTPTDESSKPEAGLHLLVLSRGLNGKGAFTMDGKLYQPCEGNGVDLQNCNGNGIFISDELSLGNPETYFDDIVGAAIRGTFDLWPTISGICEEGRFVYGIDPLGEVLCRKP